MHQIEYLSFSIEKSKSEITNIINEDVREESDSHHGLDKSIRFYDKCFDSREEAEDFIRSHDSGWYDQLAVKYKEQKNFTPSASLKKLIDRRKILTQKYWEIKNAPHFINCKSSTIGCKKCSSKISTKYLGNRNCCPVCGEDLRPKTVMEKINNYQLKEQELAEMIKEQEKAERKKNIKKADTFWLVKIEYHC